MNDDPVMAAIAASWHAILDADPFDPERRLIDTGADSLRVMQFVMHLEHALGRTVPFDLLSPELTATALAASLGGGQGEGEDRTASLPQIFYLSGLNGTDYQMVSHLRAAFADVFVFTHAAAPGLDQPRELLCDMAATAAWIAADIAARQPDGPIRLAGYSIGAMQAFEAARQLIAGGREVAFLCLFDPILPRSIPQIIKDALRRPGQLPAKLKARMPRLQRSERKNADQGILVDLALRLGAYGLASKAARVTGPRNAAAVYADPAVFRLWHWRLRAARRWCPWPLAVDALLVMTEDGSRYGAAWFWRRWIDGLTILAVPGSHDALSKAPISAELRSAVLALPSGGR